MNDIIRKRIKTLAKERIKLHVILTNLKTERLILMFPLQSKHRSL